MGLSRKVAVSIGTGLAAICILSSNPKKANCTPKEPIILQASQQTEMNYSNTKNKSWIQKNKGYLIGIGGAFFALAATAPIIRAYQRRMQY